MHTHHARQKANHTHLKTALLHRLAALQACFFSMGIRPSENNGLSITQSRRRANRPPNAPLSNKRAATFHYHFQTACFIIRLFDKAFGNPPAFRQTPRQTQEESTR